MASALSSDQLDEPGRREWATEVMGSLAALPLDEQQALLAVYFRRQALPDVATAMGVPPEEARVSVMTGLTRLGLLLGSKGSAVGPSVTDQPVGRHRQ